MNKSIFISTVVFLLLNNGCSGQQPVQEYSLQVAAMIPNSNEKKYGEWKNYPTRTIQTLNGYRQKNNIPTDGYGGREDKKFKATGFFYAVKENGRWWIVNPDGNAMVNLGMNNVSVPGTDSSSYYMKQAFGEKDHWALRTQTILDSLGFNALGAWSANDLLLKNRPAAGTTLSYTIIKNFMSDYGKKRGGTYQKPGHTGYPDNTIFVFDPEFEAFCDEYAKQLAAFKDDKNLFGYFSDNEMPFQRLTLDNYLNKKDTTDHGYKAAKQWLKDLGLKKEEINDSIRHEFLGFVADRYYSIVSKAIKKYDPNHLYLGSRFHSYEKNVKQVFEAAGKYIDVIAVNYYRTWTPIEHDLVNWEKWSGRPFIITEWYTKGEDSGMPNYSGAGWIVKTQEDRGNFYQNFALSLLESGNCVGFHWFKYRDNDPTNSDADPSNTDSNKGIVKLNFDLYKGLTDKMKELNDQVYSLIDFFDARKK